MAEDEAVSLCDLTMTCMVGRNSRECSKNKQCPEHVLLLLYIIGTHIQKSLTNRMVLIWRELTNKSDALGYSAQYQKKYVEGTFF